MQILGPLNCYSQAFKKRPITLQLLSYINKITVTWHLPNALNANAGGGGGLNADDDIVIRGWDQKEYN